MFGLSHVCSPTRILTKPEYGEQKNVSLRSLHYAVGLLQGQKVQKEITPKSRLQTLNLSTTVVLTSQEAVSSSMRMKVNFIDDEVDLRASTTTTPPPTIILKIPCNSCHYTEEFRVQYFGVTG